MPIAATAAFQLNIHAESDRAGVAQEPAEPAQLESDQLLVAALNAVAQLRDAVDRIVVFDQLRRLLEHDQRALDQAIANDQGTLDALISERRARLNEMRARREYLLRMLRPPRSEFSPERPSASSE